MFLKEGLADLGEEVFGPAVVKEAAFPGEDFGAIGEENVLVGEGRDEGRIHEGGGVAVAFESCVGTRGNSAGIGEGVVRMMTGETGLARRVGERGVGENETPDLREIGRLLREDRPRDEQKHKEPEEHGRMRLNYFFLVPNWCSKS